MSRISQDIDPNSLQKLSFKELDQISNDDQSIFQTDLDGDLLDSFDIPDAYSQDQKGHEKSKEDSRLKDPKVNKSSNADKEQTDAEAQDKGAAKKASDKVLKKNKKGSSTEETSGDIDVQALKEEVYQKGFKEGQRETEQKLQTTIQAFSKAVEDISRLRESIYKQSKQDMISMVMSVVSQVIQVEVVEKEEIIEKVIQKALESAIQSEEYHIKVNPEDYELVDEKKPLFVARLRGLGSIVFEPDSSITRGGCKVESDQGEVDATIETQLEEINRNFVDLMKAE